MIGSAVLRLPKDWRQTVSVKRTVRNPSGGASTSTTHTIDDCVFVPESTMMLGHLSTVPTTEPMLYGPVAVDLAANDEVTFPECAWHPRVVATVVGDPQTWPLGVAAKLSIDAKSRR